MLTETRTRELLAKPGAIVLGHFVGTNGDHLNIYIAKDKGTRLTTVASELCLGIAERFAADDIDVVVAPAVGGIPLSQWGAHHLSRLRPDRPEVIAAYAERVRESILARAEPGQGPKITIDYEDSPGPSYLKLEEGDEIVVLRKRFKLGRGFADDVRGKRTLLFEDVFTTGRSAGLTGDCIREAGGILIGVGVLANGGGITSDMLGVDRLEALVNVERRKLSATACAENGMCAEGEVFNTAFGHAAKFLRGLPADDPRRKLAPPEFDF